ncbi:MAG TPA: methyltransferase domain-containing protein [Polyangiaceae bacterium]|jgi:ubiquinone/menaquinone biosynthesis C-methylase UbiE
MGNEKLIQDEFRKQSKKFDLRLTAVSNPEYLSWTVDKLPLTPDMRVLDVAAGTGQLGRAIAPHVRNVVAVDITEEMIEVGRRASHQLDLRNIEFLAASAYELPFVERSFDLVVSRLSVHHFDRPEQAMAEMARVCRPSGPVAIIDMVAPATAEQARSFNEMEKLRDPSHVQFYTLEGIQKLMNDAGVEPKSHFAKEIPINVDNWLELSGASEEMAHRIKLALQNDLSGASQTGMNPYWHEGALFYNQTWVTLLGTARA